MQKKERKLREFIRKEVHNLLNEKKQRNKKQVPESEEAIRQEVRSAIYEILSDEGNQQQQLTEGVMGMADMPAVNPAQSFSQQGQQNFSYDPDAVSQMAQRDRQSNSNRGGGQTLRTDSDLQKQLPASNDGNESTGPSKTGFEDSTRENQKVMFENKESGDRASLWIEGNQLVCEYESKSRGSQRTKLSEERTREILESILNENFQM